MEKLLNLWHGTGLFHLEPGQALMTAVCMLLIYLAIKKGFEPLLLIPIGFGGILANIPVANMAVGGGILHLFYEVGLPTSVFPLLIFMGVGAMTDFGPMLANPKTLLLGAAAQIGIFGTLIGALAITAMGIPGMEFTMRGRLDRDYRWGRWPDLDLRDLETGPASARSDCSGGLFLHGAGAIDPAADHALADHQGRAWHRHGATAPCQPGREDHLPAGADCADWSVAA